MSTVRAKCRGKEVKGGFSGVLMGITAEGTRLPAKMQGYSRCLSAHLPLTKMLQQSIQGTCVV